MEILISSAILLAASTLAIIIHRQLFPHFAGHYISLLLGMGLVWIPVVNDLVWKFNSEIFMGFVIAPLLFFDGQSTRLRLVSTKFKSIVSMTVVMVLVILLVAGFTIQSLFKIGLPLAFLLAAISIPTDATATDAVTDGLIMPKRPNILLKLESLFNDASGLILLSMATLWFQNGYINYQQTLMDFLISAFGGATLGYVSSWLLMMLRQQMFTSKVNFLNNTYNNGTPMKVIFFATPFLIYFIAEEIHVSGIIAVVVAGLVGNTEAQRSKLLNPMVYYDSVRLIEMISEILNGVVFVVLGIVLMRTYRDEQITYGSWTWIYIGIVLYLSNLIVRFLYSKFVMREKAHTAKLFALGGVHGAVTFALVMMLEHATLSTRQFNLAIMSESVLIILSLLVPSILFRFVLDKDVPDDEMIEELTSMRVAMVEHARQQLNEIYVPDRMKPILEYDLNAQIGQTSTRDFIKQWQKASRVVGLDQNQTIFLNEIYHYIFDQERDYLAMIEHRESKYHEVFNILYKEIMMAEMVSLRDDNEE